MPAGTFRYVLHASVEHTDTGVTHTAWMGKEVGLRGAQRIGLPTDRSSIVVGEPASLIGTAFLLPGDFIFGEVASALVVGAMFLNLIVIDFTFDSIEGIGEYVMKH